MDKEFVDYTNGKQSRIWDQMFLWIRPVQVILAPKTVLVPHKFPSMDRLRFLSLKQRKTWTRQNFWMKMYTTIYRDLLLLVLTAMMISKVSIQIRSNAAFTFWMWLSCFSPHAILRIIITHQVHFNKSFCVFPEHSTYRRVRVRISIDIRHRPNHEIIVVG